MNDELIIVHRVISVPKKKKESKRKLIDSNRWIIDAIGTVILVSASQKKYGPTTEYSVDPHNI